MVSVIGPKKEEIIEMDDMIESDNDVSKKDDSRSANKQ